MPYLSSISQLWEEEAKDGDVNAASPNSIHVR
jgi:hypothetical protein